MSISTSLLTAHLLLALSLADRRVGQVFFVAIFVLLLAWLILMPTRLIGQDESKPPWYRNVRIWAIIITVIQIVVYSVWA